MSGQTVYKVGDRVIFSNLNTWAGSHIVYLGVWTVVRAHQESGRWFLDLVRGEPPAKESIDGQEIWNVGVEHVEFECAIDALGRRAT